MPRRTKNLPELQNRRAEVIRLRSEGFTWQEIADRTGYANASSALKAFKAAVAERPALAVDEIRAQERERLEAMDSHLAKIVETPPIKSTSIGRVMWDPRTCSCIVGGDTKRDHEPGCKVEPVLDMGQVTRCNVCISLLVKGLRGDLAGLVQ